MTLSILTGCVLPIPNRTVDAYGVKGTIIDAGTCASIEGARITNIHYTNLTSISASDGTFTLRPRYQWHAGYLFGVALSYPIWPYGGPKVMDQSVLLLNFRTFEY